jgi:hypothetical protein
LLKLGAMSGRLVDDVEGDGVAQVHLPQLVATMTRKAAGVDRRQRRDDSIKTPETDGDQRIRPAGTLIVGLVESNPSSASFAARSALSGDLSSSYGN